VVLVLGYKADEIRAVLKSRIRLQSRLKAVFNPDFDKGMSTSIIAGLAAVEMTHDHMMILLADMPFVRGEVIDLLLARYLASKKPIGAIKLKNGFGHPVVFNRSVYPELRRLEGDTGARPIVQKYDQDICLVEPTLAYDPLDIDTHEDFTRAEKMIRSRREEIQ
jgi:molybdenum cofactor cytidylyltransferase